MRTGYDEECIGKTAGVQVQANGAEKDLVRYLLKSRRKHPLSIHVLAERTYTSAATIIRLCKKLGFSGYKEFSSSLNYDYGLRSQARKDISTEISRDDDRRILWIRSRTEAYRHWRTRAN